MTQWAAFTGLTLVVLCLLLVLTHLTQDALTDPAVSSSPSDHGETQAIPAGEGIDDEGAHSSDGEASHVAGGQHESPIADEDAAQIRPEQPQPPARGDPASMSTGMLFANVAVSQGLFAGVLLGAIVITGIPAEALGITISVEYLLTGLFLGTVFGVALYVANELAAAGATRFGFDHDEGLREMLAPETSSGWAVLLFVVLPIIAVFEELLFRAALIGVLSAGFAIDPWLLAIFSSVAFALGHGIQGTVGIIVTGGLGFVLAAIFILTGSFLVVVVAHYFINALEFVIHEGFGIEWAAWLETEAA